MNVIDESRFDQLCEKLGKIPLKNRKLGWAVMEIIRLMSWENSLLLLSHAQRLL